MINTFTAATARILSAGARKHGCMFVPVGCDGCHGDLRRRACLGSSCRSSGTCPGLWPSSTTGSQTFHPREVWYPTPPRTQAHTHAHARASSSQIRQLCKMKTSCSAASCAQSLTCCLGCPAGCWRGRSGLLGLPCLLPQGAAPCA